MKRALLAITLSAYAFATAAQEPATVTISGTVEHPLMLTISDLKAMPAVDITISQQTDRGLRQASSAERCCGP